MSGPVGKRIEFIDAVRGLAALLVMVSHLGEAWRPEKSEVFQGSYLNLGVSGVVAFFLVSGFIIPYSLEKTNSVWKFWMGRIFRIYPLYLLVLALSIGLGFLGVGYWAKDVLMGGVPRSIFFHLFLIQDYVGLPNLVGGSWTLSLEMAWYAFFSLIFFLNLQRHWKYLWLFAGIFLLASIGLALLMKHHFPFGRFGMFVTCITGYFFYMNTRGHLTHGQLFSVTASLFLLILIGLFVSVRLGDDRYSFACLFFSWNGAYALFILFFTTRFWKTHFDQLFVYLGGISYSVYLVHGLILPVLSMYLGKSFWLLITGPLLSIGAATLTYRYIEQPGIHLGKYLTEAAASSSGEVAPPRRKT